MYIISLNNPKSNPFELKGPSIHSNMYKCIQPTQMNTQLHRTCIQASKTLKSTLTTFKYALVYLQRSYLQTSKHQSMLQTCNNAYGISQFLIFTNHMGLFKPYSFYTSNSHHPMNTKNLMLYLLHKSLLILL